MAQLQEAPKEKIFELFEVVTAITESKNAEVYVEMTFKIAFFR